MHHPLSSTGHLSSLFAVAFIKLLFPTKWCYQGGHWGSDWAKLPWLYEREEAQWGQGSGNQRLTANWAITQMVGNTSQWWIMSGVNLLQNTPPHAPSMYHLMPSIHNYFSPSNHKYPMTANFSTFKTTPDKFQETKIVLRPFTACSDHKGLHSSI